MKAAQSAILLLACSTISAVSAQCTNAQDGIIPGGKASPAYGYTCADWAGDLNGNGVVDCYASQDSINIADTFTAAEMKKIREYCPESCTQGAPRSKLNHLLGTITKNGANRVKMCTRRLSDLVRERRLNTSAPAPTPPPTPPPTPIPYCVPPPTTTITVTSTNVSTTATTTNTTLHVPMTMTTMTTTNTTTVATMTTTNTTTLSTVTTTNTSTLVTVTTTNSSTTSYQTSTNTTTTTGTSTTTNTTTRTVWTNTSTYTTVTNTSYTVTTTNVTTLTTGTTTNTTLPGATMTTTNTTTLTTMTTTNTTVVTVVSTTTSNASTSTQYCIPFVATPKPTPKPTPKTTPKPAPKPDAGAGTGLPTGDQKPSADCTQPDAGTGCNTNCIKPPQVSPVTCDCQTFTGGETQASCSLWNVLFECMGSTGAFHCPEGSSSAKLTNYVQLGGVKCEVCSTNYGPNNNITDLDTRTSFVMFTIKWGPLQNRQGGLVNQGGAIRYTANDASDSYVKSYTVWFVDANGRRLQHAKDAFGANIDIPATPQKAKFATCCQPDKYQITVKDQMPSGAKYLMIVPKYLAAKGALGQSGLREADTFVELPQGVIIPVADVEGETQTVVKGSIELVFTIPAGASSAELIKNEGFIAGVADGLASSLGIDASLITITNVIVVARRRLSQIPGRRLAEVPEGEARKSKELMAYLDEAEARRLEGDKSVKVDYEIIVPGEGSTLKGADGKAITAESLKAKLTSNTIADTLKAEVTKSVNKKIESGAMEVPGFTALVVKDVPKDKIAAPEEEVLEAPKPAAPSPSGPGAPGSGAPAPEGEATGGVHHKSSVGVLASILAVAATMSLLGRIV